MSTTQGTRSGRRRGHGEGTIYQSPTRGWVAQVSLPDGRRKSFYGKTRRDVQRKLAQALHDVQQGRPVPTGRLTFGRFLSQWLDVVTPTLRPATARSYAGQVRVHIAPALGALPLHQVTPDRLQTFLNAKQAAGLSPRSVQYLHAVIRTALGRAVTWNLIADNPAQRVTPPRVPRHEVQALTRDQAQAILAAFKGDPFEALVTLTLTLGLRQGEALGLRWADVDLDARTLTVRHQVTRAEDGWRFTDLKTARSRRTLPLPGFLVETLREHRTRQLAQRLARGPAWTDLDLVFPAATGAPLNGPYVTHRFARHLVAAGLPRMRFHDLRHGAATVMKAMGVDLRTIMEVLGHSQISITANLYTHVAPDVLQDVAARLDAEYRG